MKVFVLFAAERGIMCNDWDRLKYFKHMHCMGVFTTLALAMKYSGIEQGWKEKTFEGEIFDFGTIHTCKRADETRFFIVEQKLTVE